MNEASSMQNYISFHLTKLCYAMLKLPIFPQSHCRRMRKDSEPFPAAKVSYNSSKAQKIKNVCARHEKPSTN